jgi:hypothetical protein
MRQVLTVVAAIFLLAESAVAQVVTLECPRKPDGRDSKTIVQERYQITLNPPSVYKSWKRSGGKYAHDWIGENLLVETISPYKIRAYRPAERVSNSYTMARIDYDIDRSTLVITNSVRGSEQCARVKNAPSIKPKF